VVNLNKCFLMVVMVLCASSSACHARQCTFDPNSIKQPGLKGEVVQSTTWNKDRLEYRAILADGAVLFVKYWACEHYGLSAELAATVENGSDKTYRELIERVARAVLDKELNAAVVQALTQQKSFAVGQDIDFRAAGITEGTLSIRRIGVLTLVSVSYYRN